MAFKSFVVSRQTFTFCSFVHLKEGIFTMRLVLLAISLLAVLFASFTTAAVTAAVITTENFEGGATGWSNNRTTIGPAAFSEFLGSYDGTQVGGLGVQVLTKTFALSGLQTAVTVAFDFYEIDSWDGRVNFEAFQVFIDNNVVSTVVYDHIRRDEPGGIVTNLLPTVGTVNLGFLGFEDQTYRYEFSINTTATQLKLGFGASIDQFDEAWGIDNLAIHDNRGDVVPEPSAMLIWTLAGAITFCRGLRRRHVLFCLS